jgi:hypothetical protein
MRYVRRTLRTAASIVFAPAVVLLIAVLALPEFVWGRTILAALALLLGASWLLIFWHPGTRKASLRLVEVSLKFSITSGLVSAAWLAVPGILFVSLRLIDPLPPRELGPYFEDVAIYMVWFVVVLVLVFSGVCGIVLSAWRRLRGPSIDSKVSSPAGPSSAR